MMCYCSVYFCSFSFLFFSSRRRHTRCALVTGVQTCALPISPHAVPVDEVIPARWRSSVIDEEGRVNRISYELCVLAQLRDRIRSKEIWVVGADRYRNPDDDLPKDVDARREAYYTGLNLTADARAFSSAIREELAQELLLLNANIPRNDKVRLLWR